VNMIEHQNIKIATKNHFKNAWNSIPDNGKLFLLRGSVLFIVWKIIYHLFLFENRWFDKPLTEFSANSTVWLLHHLGRLDNLVVLDQVKEIINGEPAFASVIYVHNQRVLGVLDACNGLELFVLYAGLIITFSLPLKRMLSFLFGGIFLIYIVNILRLSFLSVININGHNSNIPYHFLFNTIVYAVMGVLWFFYVNEYPKISKYEN